MEPGTGIHSDLRSDADLLVAARSRDAGSFGVLYERHAGAALVVARQYISGHSEAEDVVSDAFAAVWSALQGGSGPTDSFRAYLFTVVRRVAAVQRTKGRRAEPTDDVAVFEAGSMAGADAEEPTLAGFERSVVARAFASLPERWQAVLWHGEVEGLTPAEIAPLLGLSANGAAALAYRAREGLRQAYLQQHLQDPLVDTCRTVAGKLGGYVRGGLGARDTAQVEDHLQDCGACRALVFELRDVNHGLRAIVAPLVLGTVGLGALRFLLPTTGGLAAGTASLAAGGAAAGTAVGVTAGAASGSAVGAGAVSGIGVAGASGGPAAGGMFGALGGLLTSAPAALVAGIAAIAVVAGVTVGVISLNGGRGEPAAATPFVTATSSVGVLGTSTAPSTLPGDSPSGTDGAGGTTNDAAVLSGGGLPTGSSSTPVAASQPVAGTPLLVVTDPIGGLVLDAGVTGQSLGVDVANDGTAPATALVAQVDLPTGVDPETAAQVTGRLAVRMTAAAWDCAVTGTGVTCTLPVLDVGDVTHLAVQVGVAQDFTGGDVTWRITAAGLPDVLSHPSKVTVMPWVAPAASPTATPSSTPTATLTPTPTPTPSPTGSPSPKPTPSPTGSPSPKPTPSASCLPAQPTSSSWWRDCWPGAHGDLVLPPGQARTD